MHGLNHLHFPGDLNQPGGTGIQNIIHSSKDFVCLIYLIMEALQEFLWLLRTQEERGYWPPLCRCNRDGEIIVSLFLLPILKKDFTHVWSSSLFVFLQGHCRAFLGYFITNSPLKAWGLLGSMCLEKLHRHNLIQGQNCLHSKQHLETQLNHAPQAQEHYKFPLELIRIYWVLEADCSHWLCFPVTPESWKTSKENLSMTRN